MPLRTLYELFTRSMARLPDQPALEVKGTGYSYRDLHDQAEWLAARLTREIGDRPRRIGLLAMRGHVAYVGYLAALRLGATVVPLNSRFPSVRNRGMCTLAKVDLVLADEAGARQVADDPEWAMHRVIALADEDVASGTDVTLPAYDTTPDDVAYLMFTSGSTGRPKGVPIRHRNVSPFVEHNITRYDVRPGDRVSHTFDLTFDPSVFDLFVTWAAGATLVVPQRTELLAPVNYITDHGLTHWFSAPSVVSVSQTFGKLTGVARTLRHSMFIGEQLTIAQATAWHGIAPQARIANVYGPTELTVACAGYELPMDPGRWPSTSNDTVPIGQVYDFLDWMVLADRPVSTEDGELVVRGSQRFTGYLDPEDDVGRFVRVDGGAVEVFDGSAGLTEEHYYRTGDRVRLEHGNWVHHGRLDDQVKINGYRVELGEIETAMRRHPAVDQSVVIVTPRDDLVAFYTGSPVPRQELARWLRRQLPTHMVPRRFEHLAVLPLNVSGKADRGRLRELLAGTAN